MRIAVGAALAALLGGCGAPDAGGNGRGSDMVIPACSWPASADTRDVATNVGCLPRSMFQICEVPSGSVIHADGTITTPSGGTVTCRDPCSPLEYALECLGDMPATIPQPDASLHCRTIPIPTPPTVLFYCCPCS